MLAALLAALAVEAATVIVFCGLLRSDRRAATREREAAAGREARLVDQVCHLAGKPWTPAPRETLEPLDSEPDVEREIARRW